MRQRLLFIWLALLFGVAGLRAATAYTFLSSDGKTLTFYYDNYRYSRTGGTAYNMNTGDDTPSWHSYVSNVTSVVFNSTFANARPTSCYEWFDGMTNLTSISGMSSYLNTSQVTDMRYMFYNCKKLTSVDVSGFNTANVTNMSYMFDFCSSLTSLNIRNFNLSSLSYSSGMIKGCTALSSLTIPSTASKLASNACDEVGTKSSPCTLYYPSGFTPTKESTGDGWMEWKSGYFKDYMAYAYLSSDEKTLTFIYDIFYTWTSKAFKLNIGSYTPQWNPYKNSITKVVFDPSFANARPTSCCSWFYNMTNLTTITGMQYYLNTSQVTNMNQMFYNCSNLSSIDVSGFNTANVVLMFGMFQKCNNLSYIYVGNFNTAKVKDMENMFSSCSKLTSLDISKFDLSNLSSSDMMMGGCSGLKTLTIPATASKLGTSACTGVGTESSPCKLNYPSGFTPTKESTGDGWFKWKSGYFLDDKAYANLSSDQKTLTFYYDKNWQTRSGFSNYSLNTGANASGWHSYASSVTSVVFDSSFKNARPTSCYEWFDGMTNLTSISGMSSYLNTSQVTNMRYLFWHCSSLSTVDLSGFNTSNVTSFASMFSGCSNLTTITGYTNFNTSNVTEMLFMFYNCSKLTSLDISKFDLSKLTYSGDMMSGCSALKKLTIPSTASKLASNACTGVGTESSPCTLVYPSGFTPEKEDSGDGWYMWKSGYFTDSNTKSAYAFLSSDGKTLTFYYDANRFTRTGGTPYELNIDDDYPLWNSNESTVTKVVFDASFKGYKPNTTKEWFYKMTSLKSITNLKYLDTSEVKDMTGMFARCTSLTSIDLSNFNTAKVTCFAGMFENCSNLKSLDVSKFNTANATGVWGNLGGMMGMFRNCSSLTTLDLSNFNTSKVESMGMMFQGCSNLESVNLSSFNTSKVNYFAGMFMDCPKLTELDLSNFDFSQIEGNDDSSSSMMKNCTGLKKLTIPATASYLAPNACTGVGTESSPCTLVYPSGFTPEKEDSGDGWFKWKSGYFSSASGGILGDANGDGEVTVNDVQMVVEYVLGKNPSGIVLANCDVTGDNEVSINDVNAIVSMVLNGPAAIAPNARESLTDMVALTARGSHCSLHLDNSEPYHAFQLEVVLPEGGSIGNVQLAQGRANGHHAEWNEVMPGRYNVVVYATNGEALRDGSTTALMHFDIAGCKADDVSVEGIQMIDGWCKTVLLPSTSGIATGISWVVDDASEGSSSPYYNTVGVGSSTPQRGVNIKDGRKVVKK